MKRLLLFLLVPFGAVAQDFQSIIAEVESNNPALAAERAAAGADAAARIAANRLEGAEAAFGYKWPDAKGESTKLDFEVTQAFDWPGVYAARSRASRTAARAAQARIDASRRELNTRTRTLLCELVDANLRCTLLRRIAANVDTLHQAMHRLLAERQITELYHRKVTLEELAVRRQLTEAEGARAATLSALAALNGGTLPAGCADLDKYPSQQLLPLADYLNAAAPEVETLRLEADTRTLDARAERLGLLPGFSVGYAMEREAGVNWHGFTLGLRLPQYGAKPAAEAATLEAQALQLQAEQAEAERRAMLTTTHRRAQDTEQLITLYTEALGQDYNDLLLRSLRAGQISYIEYFSELNYYLDAHLEYLTNRLQLQKLLITLNGALAPQ